MPRSVQMSPKAQRSDSRTPEEWEMHKDIIYQKYIVENVTIDELSKYLTQERNFQVR